jgi:hypothetical protein
MDSVFAVAEIQPYCNVSDARLSLIPMEKRGGGLGLFVLNGTRRKVAGDIIFQQPVIISDLSVSLSATSDGLAETRSSSRFSLEVPACGIFPLGIDGHHLNDQNEKYLAGEISSEPSQDPLHQATSSAKSELPGLESSVWN